MSPFLFEPSLKHMHLRDTISCTQAVPRFLLHWDPQAIGGARRLHDLPDCVLHPDGYALRVCWHLLV